jgi:hypothetical protein
LTLFASFDRSHAPRPGVRRTVRKAIRAAGRSIVSTRTRAAVTVLAFLLSCWLGARHDAATTHVRCAQHGELMDGGAPGASRAVAPDPACSVRVAGDQVVRGHEHCTLGAVTRASRILPTPPAIAAARVAVAPRTVAVVRAVVARDRARYRTAPKTSPPA